MPAAELMAFMHPEVWCGLLPAHKIPDLLALTERWPPDLIVRDERDYSGCIAAEINFAPFSLRFDRVDNRLCLLADLLDAGEITHLCLQQIFDARVAMMNQCVRLLANVYAGGDEMRVDERSHFRIGIHLGLQPSATASHGRRGEIEQHMTVLSLRLFERANETMPPRDLMHFGRHGTPPITIVGLQRTFRRLGIR